MVTGFELATAARIVFGSGRVAELGALAREFGTTVLVVTGGNRERIAPVLASLREKGLSVTNFSVLHEPTVAVAEAGARLAREADVQCVVAVGGGSVLDAGKAVAALATNFGPAMDYLEVIGRALPLERAPLPVIAVPTTAGTGAEVTRNAVLHAPEQLVKVSLRHALMLPRVALVDPVLTHGLPPALTASTGMDALTQLIEPFVSRRANPLTDGFCREAIPRAARSLHRAFSHGGDASARAEMALASLCGGLALANAGLGAVHGFAAPIGGMFPAPHGAVCAALLPEVMEVNICVARASASAAIMARFDEVARLLTGRPTATADEGVAWVRELRAALEIPRLSSFGIRQEHHAAIAGKALASSSMKGNPVPLELAQLVAVLEAAG